jgi:YidC/Oxa1 family membrane protein insertase
MPILFALYRVIYSIPAYVTIVKNAFSPLVEDLLATTGASDFLMTLSSASMFKGQFTNAAFTSGDTTYIKNTFIDVLNKASTADWNSLTAQFPSLSASIENTHTALSRFNYFLGLNISDTPMYMIKTAFADRHFILLIGGLIVPFLAALTQWINVKLMPQPENNNKVDPNDPTAQMQQSMKTMNLMMPLMSAFFCLSLPAGMGIYWIAGAVVRSIQQVVINKHIDKIDIDAVIEKNSAKYKEKMEKMKSTPQMNRYANLSTRSNTLAAASSSSVSEEEKDKKLKAAAAVYQGKEIRKDSLLAKANMVKDFNEKNNK